MSLIWTSVRERLRSDFTSRVRDAASPPDVRGSAAPQPGMESLGLAHGSTLSGPKAVPGAEP